MKEQEINAYTFDDISNSKKITNVEKELLELERTVYSKDLFAFNSEVLGVSINNKEVQKPWCKLVCKCKTNQYILLLAPRGHLKTTNITIGYSLFRLIHNKNIRILLVNATASNAQGFLRVIKDHLTSNIKFKQIYGDYTAQSDKWTERTIIVDRTKRVMGPTMEAIGILGNLVSQHYDLIIADDVVNLQDINSPTIRKKKLEWFLSLFDVLEPEGQMVLIGTRWDEMDLYGEILRLNEKRKESLLRASDDVGDDYSEKHAEKFADRRFKVRIDKAILPDGKPLYPSRFSAEYLQFLKETKGAFFFAQYMNDPTGIKGRPFKREWIHYYGDGDLPKNLRIVQGIDLASRILLSSDYFAIVTLGFDEFNNVWLIDYYLDKIDGPEQMNMLKAKAATFKPELIFVESNSYQLVLYQFLMADKTGKLLSGIVHPEDSIKNKDLRLRGMAPVFEYNKVMFHKDKHSEFIEQLIAYPSVEHDDLLDAFEMALMKGQMYLFEQRSNEPSIRGMG